MHAFKLAHVERRTRDDKASNLRAAKQPKERAEVRQSLRVLRYLPYVFLKRINGMQQPQWLQLRIGACPFTKSCTRINPRAWRQGALAYQLTQDTVEYWLIAQLGAVWVRLPKI